MLAASPTAARIGARLGLGLVLAAVLVFAPWRSSGQTPSAYTLYTETGRRTLPFRVTNGIEMISLDQLATFFNLTVTEDAGVGGLIVRGRGQTILLIPGQSFASIGPGTVRSLSGPIQRDRNAWQVPIDFLRQALGPALNARVEIRRPSRIILIGDVRVPQVTGRVERVGTGVRIAIEAQPGAPHRVTRDGNRLTIKFEATALDATPLTGFVPEFASSARIDGTSIVIELGPQAASFRPEDRDENRLWIEVLPAPPPPPPPPPAPRPAPAPQAGAQPPAGQPGAAPPTAAPGTVPATEPPQPAVVDIQSLGGIRTIVIDPGHGGDDAGAKGAKGTLEKDYVLQLARRLKGTIESRLGLRVLLTRDGDENVPVDRRTALANNNKADLFISLHANASVREGLRGAQVISLRAQDYQKVPGAPIGPVELPVPVLGGGTRSVDVVPWDLAQIPFASKSAALAAILGRTLTEKGVPLAPKPVTQMPMRVLVGANMPAVLLEVGFLTNNADEPALIGADRSGALIDALMAMIGEARRGLPGRQP